MKKLFLLISILCIITIPTKQVEAKSYSFGGYYCDAKQSLGNGTFYLTCHIVAKTDFEINHIEGDLILKNVKLESIRTNSDWVSNNGLSSRVSFTSSTPHIGSFAVADLVFIGNESDTECEASFAPDIAEKQEPETPEMKACAIIDNEYYGKNATKVTEEKYYEECCNYVCTIVDNKYYFDSKGKSVSYEKFKSDCSESNTVITPIPDSPQTGIDYGYIILPIGVISIIGIIKFTKKNAKIYKI